MVENKMLDQALKILYEWEPADSRHKIDMIESFYSMLHDERAKKSEERWNPIVPGIHHGYEELIARITQACGAVGMEDLLVYLLENDNRFINTDTFENYQTFKPHPSYFIVFAYTIIYYLPKGARTRRLFDAFWEHQARVRPGLDEQFARHYLNAFFDEGISSREEVKERMVSDWVRWQTKGYPYYGAALGPSIWYFGYGVWKKVESMLEKVWVEYVKKEPKKWGN